MPLVLRIQTDTTIPIEVDSVRLETVRTMPPGEVSRILVQHGNRQEELGQFFSASGSAGDDNELVWEGDCSRVKLIGDHLSEGRIRVEGNAGMHLGAEMTGGEIIVSGNAADWVGAEMHGGRIHVRGNAGHLVGAVYRGGRRGMTGGIILVDGNVGNEVGHTMRRGVIAVGGNAGDAIGFNMIAGTVLVFGEMGIRPGAGMRRGTIGLLGNHKHPDMLPTFRAAGLEQPSFLHFYLHELRRNGFDVPDDCFTASYRRFCGDMLEMGKGEILVREAA
ncbi:MAG: formylmethanofuran dehydrogenase subunit C [Planctomycetaceae bacterium]